jgi:hypothetical protein
MTDPQTLADRYANLWNEPDYDCRRREIETLWHRDGAHFVRSQSVQGFDALLQRVTGSWERSVKSTGNRFVAHRDAQRLSNAVTFHWDMIRSSDQKVLARGLEFLVLDADGLILADYQFNLP